MVILNFKTNVFNYILCYLCNCNSLFIVLKIHNIGELSITEVSSSHRVWHVAILLTRFASHSSTICTELTNMQLFPVHYLDWQVFFHLHVCFLDAFNNIVKVLHYLLKQCCFSKLCSLCDSSYLTSEDVNRKTGMFYISLYPINQSHNLIHTLQILINI